LVLSSAALELKRSAAGVCGAVAGADDQLGTGRAVSRGALLTARWNHCIGTIDATL
jgi:hypothetical protein